MVYGFGRLPGSLYNRQLLRSFSNFSCSLSVVHIFFIWCRFELKSCKVFLWYLRMLFAKSCDLWGSLSRPNNSTKRDHLLSLTVSIGVKAVDLWKPISSLFVLRLSSNFVRMFHDTWRSLPPSLVIFSRPVGGSNGSWNIRPAATFNSADVAKLTHLD